MRPSTVLASMERPRSRYVNSFLHVEEDEEVDPSFGSGEELEHPMGLVRGLCKSFRILPLASFRDLRHSMGVE